MRGFRRRSDSADIEGRLRQARPQPSRNLVNGIVARIEARSLRRAFGLRVGLAAGMTAIFVAAFAGLGAFGYAEIAVSNAAKKVHGTQSHDPHHDPHHPHHDQYAHHRVTICHRPSRHPHHGRTLVLPEPAAEAHLKRHKRDTPGAC